MVKKVKLKNGQTATISFLSRKDDAKEFLRFINGLIKEGAYITWGKKFTLKQENEWIKAEVKNRSNGRGHLLVARINGKLAGNSGAGRDLGREKDSVQLGIAIAKEFRGIGLGEALLSENIRLAKKMRPKTLYLTVMAPNKRARALYRKLGFREFAIFPKWAKYGNRYVDKIFMKL